MVARGRRQLYVGRLVFTALNIEWQSGEFYQASLAHGNHGVSPFTSHLRVVGAGAREEEEERREEARSSDCGAASDEEEVKVTKDEMEMDAEPEELAPIRVARNPGDPSTKEREEHNVTHIPYRSWCPVCVKAKGKEDPHRRSDGDKSVKATVCYDYKTFGQEVEYDDKATAIVSKDDKTKIRAAHLCETKGFGDPWIVDKILEDLDRLGHHEVILKGDGEPALQDLLNKVKK